MHFWGWKRMNKLQMAEQLRKALQIFAQTLSNEEAMEVATVYPAWSEGVAYVVDQIVSYGVNAVDDPQLYRCVQAHTSQAEWTPSAAASLWVAIGLAPDDIPVWSQPTGAHDAYNKGDKVHYPNEYGFVYESLIDGNIYSPEAYPAGWELVE